MQAGDSYLFVTSKQYVCSANLQLCGHKKWSCHCLEIDNDIEHYLRENLQAVTKRMKICIPRLYIKAENYSIQFDLLLSFFFFFFLI